jgi:hypothetical protein
MSQNSTGTSDLVTGRIVWTSGDLFKGEHTKDMFTKALKFRPDGKPVIQYGFGLAVPKSQAQSLYSKIMAEAAQIFPNGLPPSFALKFKDGDSIDDKGIPFSNRTGYKDHLIFALTTQIAPKFYINENGAYMLVNQGFKCGDYVQVQVDIKAHGAIGQGKAGTYLNPMAVLFVKAGEAIVNTPSPDSIFGAPPVTAGQPVNPFAGQPAPVAQAPMAPPVPNYAVLPNQQPQGQQAPAGFPFGNK